MSRIAFSRTVNAGLRTSAVSSRMAATGLLVRSASIAAATKTSGTSSRNNHYSKYAVTLAIGTGVAGSLVVDSVHAETTAVDWKALAQDIEEIIESEESVNPSVDGTEGQLGGGGDIGPMMVRLAWHSAGSFSVADNNGGSNGGTMRFAPESDHGCNAGLGNARDLLEPLKAKYPGVTYADLYIYAGKVAIELMGGPTIGFKYGRTDVASVKKPEDDNRFSPDGRLPDGGRPTGDNPELASTIQHIRDVFNRMGFNDREIVALSGGHAMGRCHTDRSGYWGPWTFAPNTFSNEYFRLLFEETWSKKKTHNGGPWNGPVQYEDPTGQLMMLPTDMAIRQDPKFRQIAVEYSVDDEKFRKDFAAAWQKLTELGCSGLKYQSGKRGGLRGMLRL